MGGCIQFNLNLKLRVIDLGFLIAGFEGWSDKLVSRKIFEIFLVLKAIETQSGFSTRIVMNDGIFREP